MSDVHPVAENLVGSWPNPPANVVVSPDTIFSWDDCHQSEESCNSYTIELYNRNSYRVYVVWEEYFFTDKWLPFIIEPESVIIDSKESSEFVVSFHPSAENEFYSCLRRALVYRLPENDVDDANIEVNPEKLMEMTIVPEIVSIKLIGKITRSTGMRVRFLVRHIVQSIEVPPKNFLFFFEFESSNRIFG
uniref:Uncharacterized protein n=1 Tax=Trichogramma kaykai TaxID=54128 RepID=A0ABD2XEI0_9HYME